jgi:hypothetical protein
VREIILFPSIFFRMILTLDGTPPLDSLKTIGGLHTTAPLLFPVAIQNKIPHPLRHDSAAAAAEMAPQR